MVASITLEKSSNMSDRKLHQQPAKRSYALSSSEEDAETSIAKPNKKNPGKNVPSNPKGLTQSHSPALADPLPALPTPSTTPDEDKTLAFDPMLPCAPPHVGYNPLPSILRGLHGLEPYDIFKLFFTQILLSTIVLNTNAYAAQNAAGETGRAWKGVTEHDNN